MTWVSASRRLGVLALVLAFGLALSACGKKEEAEKATEGAPPAEGTAQPEAAPPAEGATKEENYPAEGKQAAPEAAPKEEAAPQPVAPDVGAKPAAPSEDKDMSPREEGE